MQRPVHQDTQGARQQVSLATAPAAAALLGALEHCGTGGTRPSGDGLACARATTSIRGSSSPLFVTRQPGLQDGRPRPTRKHRCSTGGEQMGDKSTGTRGPRVTGPWSLECPWPLRDTHHLQGCAHPQQCPCVDPAGSHPPIRAVNQQPLRKMRGYIL